MQWKGITVNLSQGIANVAAPAHPSVGYSPNICPDQYVGTFCFQNNQFQPLCLTIKNRNTTHPSFFDVDYCGTPQGNYILLILESPHIDEYDQNTKSPIGPACGKTGSNIEKYISQVFQASPSLLSRLKKGQHRLVLMNSVQYQASQGMRPLNQKIRDVNWISLWQGGFEKDLVDRVQWFRKTSGDVIVINLCTFGWAGLHFYVNEALRNNGITFFEGYHPAINWGIFYRRRIF